MEWSSLDNPIIGALMFPTVLSTRGALRKVGESQSKVQGPCGLFGLVEGNTDPRPKLCSKFQTRCHTTIHQSKHWHIYIFSFLNNIYHYIYICTSCVSVCLSPLFSRLPLQNAIEKNSWWQNHRFMMRGRWVPSQIQPSLISFCPNLWLGGGKWAMSSREEPKL